jgi:hypothetical protein
VAVGFHNGDAEFLGPASPKKNTRAMVELKYIQYIKMVRNIKKYSTTCIIIVIECKKTIIAENHLRFQGHTPGCPLAV